MLGYNNLAEVNGPKAMSVVLCGNVNASVCFEIMRCNFVPRLSMELLMMT